MAHFEGFYTEELTKNAKELCTEGKGILDADEMSEELFAEHKIEYSAENRRAFCELLCFTPSSNDYLSGVILDDDNFHQINHYDDSRAGKPFIDTLEEWGILPGIRLDTGTAQLPCTEETLTQGLDGLADRCRQYYASGARFATWRAEFTIGLLEPTDLALATNSQALGLFAFFCQDNGLVPLLQIDVLVEGKHDIQECAHVTETVLSWVIKALSDHRVMLEGVLLMPSMVLPGSESAKVEPAVVAKHTLEAIHRTVPPAIPGIFFLSRAQRGEEATLNLNAMGRTYMKKPWAISFAFGEPLQGSALRDWGGNNENWTNGHHSAYRKYKLNSKASYGYYRNENGYGSSDDDYSTYTKDDNPNDENEGSNNENENSQNEQENSQNEQENSQKEEENKDKENSQKEEEK